jgi:hypothetical protein
MAPWLSSSRLYWDGAASISQLIANLFKRQRTVLRLPAEYHPAISACLYPTSRVRKRIDRIGDARLLTRIANVEGLGELARLVTTMDVVGARLRLRSPAPHLVFNISAAPRLDKLRKRQHGEAWTTPQGAEICSGCGASHAAKPANEQLR